MNHFTDLCLLVLVLFLPSGTLVTSAVQSDTSPESVEDSPQGYMTPSLALELSGDIVELREERIVRPLRRERPF